MSRRKLGLAGLAVTIGLNGGVAMLPAADAAVACSPFSDPAGDAILAVGGPTTVAGVTVPLPSQKVDEDQDLDILDLTLNNTASELVAAISVKKLAANPAKAPGHGFTFGYTFNERKFKHSFYKYGQSAGDTAAGAANITYSSTVNGTGRAIPVTASFDLAANVVTLKVRLADLEVWAMAPVFDAPLTAIFGESATDYFAGAETYDTVKAPAEAEYRVRYGCGPDVVDVGNPPKLPARANPDVAPRAGCAFVTDKKSDGTPIILTPATAPNEPGLDIVGLNVNVTATDLKAYIQVDKLGDKPANFVGDRFEFAFSYANKSYVLAVGRVQAPFETSPPFVVQTRGQVNGTTNATIKPTGVFDKATNTIVISVSRAALETVQTTDIPLGAAFTNVFAKTWGLQPGLQFTADTANNPDDTKYTFGYSPCFLPPAAKLAVVGTPSAQFTDAATLSVKLTTEDGDVLSGKKVTFNLGSSSGSGTTNAAGVATATLLNTLTAGAGSFTASFAGDGSAGPDSLTAPFTSRIEKTKMTLSVVKSGVKRTVTATLKDDDGKPVAGQVVTWTLNGKPAGSAKTDALGKAVLKTAKPTQTVVATFAGLTDKYAPAKATGKV